MKTYYGQMTKEQLNKTYFVPNSISEMNAFILMCCKAGLEKGFESILGRCQIGVNCHNDGFIGNNQIDSNYYESKGMTQINWLPESERPPANLKSQLAEAIAKRDKCKAKLQKAADKLEQAEKEVHRLIAELENEVESIGGISCKIAEMTKPDIPEGVDVDDPTTWQKGDIVQCIDLPNAKNWTQGNEYVFLGVDKCWIYFERDDSGDANAWSADGGGKFRFVRRP